MAEQRIMPLTGEQQIKKNVLEIPWSVMLKALLNIVGNSLGSIGRKIGKASGDKAGGEGQSTKLLLSEPIEEILTGASRVINFLSTPLPQTVFSHTTVTVEEHE
ncbi:hypothetical protein X943_002743 [Babesia divergens]|uniref:Uncharacterized protein n=1 Tax=Babesia divergens TaxID=32595 RepID=A0AAD9GBC3_BABDI|nr:hypothetical protein X943_002743 [Babesia divergens]